MYREPYLRKTNAKIKLPGMARVLSFNSFLLKSLGVGLITKGKKLTQKHLQQNKKF